MIHHVPISLSVCVCLFVLLAYVVIFLSDEFDAFIVVSFTNATLVLSIGETVEEVTDSGFLGTTPTLACSRLGDDALIQVCTSCQSPPIIIVHPNNQRQWYQEAFEQSVGSCTDFWFSCYL